MAETARSIGELAHESGLSVSALRFYDAAGVLRPAHVNPLTGYRWYTADQLGQAKLIAHLRNADMPLADICDVLTARHNRGEVTRLLDAHRTRLEHALTDARQSLETAHHLLTQQERPMTQLTVRGADLDAALSAVRFAASHDPELPALNGVLFHYDGGTLRLVATDRYRLAVATVPARDQQGAAIQVIAPLTLIDDLTLAAGDDVRLELDDDSVAIGPAHADAIAAPFPDYQNILRTTPARHVSITTADMLQRVATGATRTMTDGPNSAPHEVTVVLLTDDTIDVLDHDHPDAIGFNREFLLQALQATDADQLVLAIDGPTGPLAIHDPDRPDDISLLMPTLLT